MTPVREPLPPVMAVPPRTTAAMTIISMPSRLVGVHLSHGAGADHAGESGDDADDDVEPELGGAHF